MAAPAELLKDLQYDPVTMEKTYERAYEYLKSCGGEFRSTVNESDGAILSIESVREIKIINMPYTLYVADSLKIINDIPKKQPVLDRNERRSTLMKISKEFMKNSQLLAQLEQLIRDIPQEDVLKYDVPIVMEYFNYYSNIFLDSKHAGRELFLFTKQTTLASMAMAVSSALAAGVTVDILATDPVAVVAHLFTKICINAGIRTAIHTYLVLEENLQKIIEKLNPRMKDTIAWTLTSRIYGKLNMGDTNGGCTIVVTESGDLDSAIDMVIYEATWNPAYPWSVNRLMVQESIYDDFKERFKTRIGNVKENQGPHEGSLPRGAEVWSCPIKHPFTCGARVVISENINLDEATDDSMQIVTMQSYRSTKELLALVNKDAAFAISLWCDSVSVSNEISLAWNVPVVWINMYGTLDASVPLRIRGSSLKIFGGDLGLSKHLMSNTDFETLRTYEPNAEIKHTYKVLLQSLNKKLASWKVKPLQKRITCCLEAVTKFRDDLKKDARDYEVVEAIVKSLMEPCTPESNVLIRDGKMRVYLSEPVGIALVCPNANWVHKDLVESIISVVHGNGLIYNIPEDILEDKSIFCELLKHLNASGVPVEQSAYDNVCLEALKILEIKSIFVDKGMAKASLYYTKHIWSPIGETFAN